MVSAADLGVVHPDDVAPGASGSAAVRSKNGRVEAGDGADRFNGNDWRRFLFLTSHGGNNQIESNNVRIYNYEVSAKHLHHWNFTGLALRPEEVKSLGLQNLRGMAAVGDLLYIVSAHSSRSKIIVTDKCSLEPRLAHTFAVKGLDHPYAIAYLKGFLYTANQNTDEVLRFNVKAGNNSKPEVPKRVAKVKNPRGLAFDRFGRLWVASTTHGVYVLDPSDGQVQAHIDVKHPVGVVLHYAQNRIYIGSVKDNCIYGYDTATMKLAIKLTTSKQFKLKHPAGLAIVKDRLFAVGQKTQNLYAWSVVNGAFKGAVLRDLPHRPEQVAVLRCNVHASLSPP